MSEKRMSPSLRRAWIEISASPCTTAAFRVALLAEGVDRNDEYIYAYRFAVASPSVRRAWIEMMNISTPTALELRRPPCGGRG